MTTYKVMQEVVVEAKDHAAALKLAHEMWGRDDHNELARHKSMATIEPVPVGVLTVTNG